MAGKTAQFRREGHTLARLTVRIPQSLHRQLETIAAKRKLSLNKLIAECLKECA